MFTSTGEDALTVITPSPTSVYNPIYDIFISKIGKGKGVCKKEKFSMGLSASEVISHV